MSARPDPGPEERRREQHERWERAAAGWGRRADRIREFGMPVSRWMIEHAGLHPGQRVLELAAGPGDTGFMAAGLISPGGVLISSDASEAMLEVARGRARELGIENVEFKRLELEWIDLETATVDVVMCRWAFMLMVDPEAALREARRVLKPGGRIVLAVWDQREHNPWATIDTQALVELGYADPPDPDAPGMFALAPAARLQAILEATGFVGAVIESVELHREPVTVQEHLAEQLDLSRPFAETFERLTEEQRAELEERTAALSQPYMDADGRLRLPARSLAAAADA